MRHAIRLLAVLPLLAGCGGGGGAPPGTPPTPPPGAGPSASIHFPPPTSLTTASTVVVRGTAADPDGIAEVRVNGELADSTDGFATWTAMIQLVPGANPILVTTLDDVGDADARAAEATITSEPGPMLRAPRGLALDAARERVIVMEDQGRVLTAALNTGHRAIMRYGSGGHHVAIDAAGDRAIYVSNYGPRVQAMDLATGDVTTLSDDALGSGPTFSSPGSIALPPQPNLAIVVDRTLHAVFGVNLLNGNRTILSSASTGTGPILWPTACAFDPGTGRILVGDYGVAALLSIAPATGHRTVISNASTGAGPMPSSWNSIAVDAGAGRAYVVDLASQAVFAIDLASGDRSIVSDAATGNGPALSQPRGVVLDAAAGRLLVSDSELHAVFAVDPATGDRSLFSSTSVATGPDPEGVVGSVGFEAAVGSVLMNTRGGVLALDVASGTRSIYSGSSRGTGPTIPSPDGGMAVDQSTGTLYLMDTDLDALLSVDGATGDRMVLSDATLGSGPLWTEPQSLALDAVGGRAYVADRDLKAVLAVDLLTGDRTVVSDALTGVGPLISVPSGLALDAAAGRLLLTELVLGQVIAIDISTGDRTLLAAAAPLQFNSLTGIAVDADAGYAAVLARSSLVLATLDLATAAWTHVADQNSIPGADLSWPSALVLDPAHDRAYVADTDSNAIFAVDLVTGHRVIVSK